MSHLMHFALQTLAGSPLRSSYQDIACWVGQNFIILQHDYISFIVTTCTVFLFNNSRIAPSLSHPSNLSSWLHHPSLFFWLFMLSSSLFFHFFFFLFFFFFSLSCWVLVTGQWGVWLKQTLDIYHKCHGC